MNRHSILFKLNILFLIAFIATIIAAFSIGLHTIKKNDMALLFKARLIVKEIRISGKIPTLLLKEFHFKEMRGKIKKEILREGKIRKILFNPVQKKVNNRVILTYRGHKYLHIKLKNRDNILLEDKQNFINIFFIPLFIFLGIITLLISMYILLRKNLIPLKKLEEDITSYGDGNLKEYLYLNKKDEISLASNAFYLSVEKVNRLTHSRQLFIRNIFHELNTPVTKGKLLAEIIEEPKTQKMLNSIFTRLSVLLKELANTEKITSDNYTISIKPIRITELIDEASDLLYLEKKIKNNVRDEMIEADFSLMSLVFKNLIDNALKYGSNLEIIYRENTISFINCGNILEEDFSKYTEAFYKDKSLDSKKGFGLGLYIVNEILLKHGFTFSYEYQNNKNIFIIDIRISEVNLV